MSEGKARSELYRRGIGRADRALREGFWLEAITLQESVISDRLAYLLERHGRRKPGSLSSLISAAAALPAVTALDGEVLDRAHEWRRARNKAAHAMVKLDEPGAGTWDERLRACRETAHEGRAVMREIDALVRRLLRTAQ